MNCAPSVVLPTPVGPVTSVTAPRSIPPASIASSSSMPDGRLVHHLATERLGQEPREDVQAVVVDLRRVPAEPERGAAELADGHGPAEARRVVEVDDAVGHELQVLVGGAVGAAGGE